MKLLIAFFFGGLLAVSASTYSQQTKLSIEFDEVTVKEAFKQIEENSEFVFFYNEDYIDVNRKVSINVKDKKVDSILNELLIGTNNTFKIYDRQIVILPTDMKKLPIEIKQQLKQQLKQQPQQNKGRVEGTIKDASTGEVLPFASVSFLGTTNGTLTNDKGFYSIGNIKPGNYKINVTYIGYTSIIVDISIVDDKAIVKNIGLSFKTTMGKEVTITGQAYGQIKAINTQIASRTIKNVVSEQKIRELPDANAAEALSRLPGVSVQRSGGEAVSINIRGVGSNSFYVNGMRMNGDLSSVSSSMIGGVELSKAFMPDQDADVLGGSVEFKMRDASSGFKKEIWLRQGYNDFTKSFKMQDASFTVSNRFLKDKLGVALSFNYDRKDRGRDVLGVGYSSIGSSDGSESILPVKIAGAALTRSLNLNNRYGLTAYADYKLKNGKIFYQGFFSSLNSDNKSTTNSYGLRYDSNISTGISDNIMNGIGGEHTVLGAKISWGAYLSNAKTETPVGYDFFANGNSMNGLETVDTLTTITEFLALGTHDLNKTRSDYIGKFNNKGYTNELGYHLDIEVPFKLGIINGYVKLGGKMRDIERGYENNNIYGFIANAGDLKLLNVIPGRVPQYDWPFTPAHELSIQGFLGPESTWTQDFSMLGAKIYYAPDFNKVKVVEQAVEDLLWPSIAALGNNYTNKEHFYAGYIMTGINLGKMVTFTPGVRYEKNTYSTTAKSIQELINYGPLISQGAMKDTTDGYNNVHFFPMIHLRIKPLKWFDIRMGYTNTVSRPGFSAMSPRYYRNTGFDISKGNVYLKPQSNLNYDMYLSFYTGKVGLFTVGAFYKEMEDQIMYYTVRILDPAVYGLSNGYKGKNYTQPINNKWVGHMKGVELDWQTQFSYLPRPFNGIILNANVTFMQSTTKYPFFSFETVNVVDANGKPIPPYKITIGHDNFRSSKITGMPDMVGNIALGYETGGFSGRVSAYYQSATITSAQATNITLDQSKAELVRVDVQLSQKIRKVEGLALYLNINNLTDNPDKTVLTHYPDHIVGMEKYGVAGDVGVRYKF